MAHYQQQDFCNAVKMQYPSYFSDAKVLDIGSLDVNGNNRYLFTDSEYTGLDIAEGANVDLVCKAHEYDAPEGSYSFVISTECFEHDPYYKKTILNAIRLLKSGGALLFTCATDPRLEHGTEASDNFGVRLCQGNFQRTGTTIRTYMKRTLAILRSTLKLATLNVTLKLGIFIFLGLRNEQVSSYPNN